MGYGSRIRYYREKNGMYQAQLGKALGVSAQAISKWELDKAEPDGDSIKKLCQIFGVDANDLLGVPPVSDDKAHTVSDDDIKFALFNGDQEITDEQFEEVKRFAQFIRERDRRDH